jgi:hypothetical protein
MNINVIIKRKIAAFADQNSERERGFFIQLILTTHTFCADGFSFAVWTLEQNVLCTPDTRLSNTMYHFVDADWQFRDKNYGDCAIMEFFLS